MAVNTQKLLLWLIAINLMVGLVAEIYQNPKGFNTSSIDDQVKVSEEFAQKTADEGLFGWIQSRFNEFENTVGSTLGMGWRILKIFIQGLNPFPFGVDTATNGIEQVLIYLLLLFKAFSYYITGLELYLVYKNKKSS